MLTQQKVATDSAVDADVSGWCDGVLVSFEMRAGRVRTWAQRPCEAAEAAVRVNGTPAPWRAFADRNAALAASLWRSAGS